MTYAPTIYGWRQSCAPITQQFRAGGQVTNAGVTVGGALIQSREPGGRAELSMTFSNFATPETNRDASWTISRIMSGAVMKINLYDSVQLVSQESLGAGTGGLTWSNGQKWSTDVFWQSDPNSALTQAALKGSNTFTVDTSDYGEVLELGHVIGFSVGDYDFAHVILDVVYVSGVATVTVEPPLRRDLNSGDEMKYRPSMLVQCSNPEELMGRFQSGRHMSLGDARFVEALV